jgi:hypothetical protein
VRRLVGAVALLLLSLPAPAAATTRRLGAASIGHPTMVGSRVVFETAGLTGDGGAGYIVESTGSGGLRRLVAAPAAPMREGGVLHTTGYAYAVTSTHLALAELDGSQRGRRRLGSVTLSWSNLNGKSTETIASCDQPAAPHAPPFALDGERIAFVEGACEGAPETVVVHQANVADVRIAVAAGVTVGQVALAGDYVAYGLAQGSGSPSVVVASRATGATVFHVDNTAGPFGLQPDGTLAASGGACRASFLETASPAAPAPVTVPDAHPCSPVRLSGGHAVYRDADAHLHVADVGGADRSLIDAPVGDFDADAARAVYTFPDCAGRALYRVALSSLPAAPGVPASCPVRVRSSRLRMRGTRVAVPLSCPRACRGTLTFNAAGTSARSAFAVENPGTGSAELRLRAAARRRVRSGGLRGTMTVASTGPSGRASRRRFSVSVVR